MRRVFLLVRLLALLACLLTYSFVCLFVCLLIRLLTCLLTYPLTHLSTYPLTSLTHSLPPSLTHSLASPLTRTTRQTDRRISLHKEQNQKHAEGVGVGSFVSWGKTSQAVYNLNLLPSPVIFIILGTSETKVWIVVSLSHYG